MPQIFAYLADVALYGAEDVNPTSAKIRDGPGATSAISPGKSAFLAFSRRAYGALENRPEKG